MVVCLENPDPETALAEPEGGLRPERPPPTTTTSLGDWIESVFGSKPVIFLSGAPEGPFLAISGAMMPIRIEPI